MRNYITFNHNMYSLTLSTIYHWFIISIQYIINNINQQCIRSSTDTQYTRYLRGNPNGRKPHNDFLICQKKYIHRKHQLPNSPAPTGRRLQPPIYRLQPEGSYNSLIYQLQLEGGSNPLVYRLQPEGSSNSLILWHQPEGGYNPLSLPHPATLKYKCRPNCHYHNHCHCHYTTVNLINLSLSTCHINLSHINNCHNNCHMSTLSHQPITSTSHQPKPDLIT
jgi:hypothetical protein